MRELWIGQQCGVGLRECTFVDDETKEQSTFFATDEQAREFTTEMEATIREADSYDAEMNLADPWQDMWRERWLYGDGE